MKEDLPFAHLGILVLLLLISINLVILDFKLFYLPVRQAGPPAGLSGRGNFLSQNTKSDSLPSIIPPTLSNQCPSACLDLISQSTTSSNIGSPFPSDTALPSIPSPLKEYFIPLGTGTTSKNDWENLVSTETVINPAVYGNIQETYLIVSLKNTTQNGQVEARLYNATDNYPIYGSHVIMTDKSEQTITSQKFALPANSKLFRIQLKSSLSFSVSLENARLKILAR